MLQLTSLGDKNSALFGINVPDLIQIVESIVGYTIKVYDIRFTHTLAKRFRGERANKSIPTIYWTHPTGTHETITLFIKRHHHYEQNEAIHHRYLSLTDAPIPRLYGYYSKPRERDIMISEFLTPLLIDEPYDDFLCDAGTFRAFIEATALFTSIPINPEYHAYLKYGYVEQQFRSYVHDLDRINEAVGAHSGSHMASNAAIASLKMTLRKLCDEMDTMEKGVYHWDHRPCNAGWSSLQKRLVIFDLEDTLIAPRFLDIARWLGASDNIETRYARQDRLAEEFLAIYNERKRTIISVDHFLWEVSTLWKLFLYERIRWFLHELGNEPGDIYDEDPQVYTNRVREKLQKVIAILLEERQ